ncbi:sodium:solute symporter family protein [Roseiconus nitratireducens]|nr:sodium:solute symporter family protein [Roseiconus nitratireducens]
MQWIDYAVLVTYFIVMIGIGLWAMRRVKDQEDYFLGGRGFGKLLQTFAAFGAGTGSQEPIQVGRTVWTSGLSGAWSALMWLFVTPIYWITAVWYRRMRHMTLGDWFVERYESPALGAAYTLFAISFYMAYLSTMFSAVAKFAVPLMGVDSLFGWELQYVLVPLIGGVVILYGVLGGLTAAYWTDLIQGFFIMLLSLLLIPFGLWALVEQFGTADQQSWMDGFRIMHQRIPDDYFFLFSGPSSGEFPIHYILSLSLLGMVGIVVQPHFIATGGGSAKTEDEARIGLVTGNFLKRLCTVGWALTGLIALALLAGSPEIAADPDRVWGAASREILGPLNLGLVGLMLACLLAALMSSADTYMIVTSALVVRNLYAPYINPAADEKTYVRVGRMTGLVIIVGATVIALRYADVFGQFKMALELPILFAAPFWVGMYWRRANRTAVWGTMLFSLVVFFILPPLLPAVIPSLRTNPALSATTQLVTTQIRREATESDVARRQAWLDAVAEAEESGAEDAQTRFGPSPPEAVVGEPIVITRTTGGESIFWRGGVATEGEPRRALVRTEAKGNTETRYERLLGAKVGQGSLNIDFVLYSALGFDLSWATKASLETLRLPARLFTPFLVFILLSWITPRGSEETLKRYYAKMRTPVLADPEQDRQAVRHAYEKPVATFQRKIFPGSDLEFYWPSAKDVIGFVVSVVICVVIIGLLVWITSIGA